MEKRTEIEDAIIRGVPLRTIGDQFGISHQALMNHRDNCIPALIAKLRADADEFNADNLLVKLEMVKQETWSLYVRVKDEDPALALKCLRAAESQIATAGRIIAAIMPKKEQGPGVNEILASARRRVASRIEEKNSEPSV